MTSSFWNEFLKFVENSDNKNPIIASLLKQVKLLEMADNSVVLSCENQGVRMYLEKKRELIESLLWQHTQLKMTIVFTVIEKKTIKNTPLLSFEPSLEDAYTKSGLHTKYKLENYAVSNSNRVAYAAAQAVAQNPGASYNPLFFYGGVGVGKTHLAQGIAQAVLNRDAQKHVFFSPGDHFINELIDSIRERTTAKFKRKYRSLDVLIVDDIQFIAGKQTVQEEFFHTFNSIVSAGGQIILTSDRPPNEIKNLEDRLRSRFSGGLIVDIQSPDFELRTAILLIKAKEKNIEIDMEAAKIIAERIGDSRGLEGGLLSIYAKILGVKDRIDLETVEMFFQEKVETRIKKIDPGDVIKAVCSCYNIKQSHLKSATRTEEIAFPRQIAMYLLRQELKIKYEEIAIMLKRKDHTTIMHGVEKISRLLIKDPSLKQEVDRIIQLIRPST